MKKTYFFSAGRKFLPGFLLVLLAMTTQFAQAAPFLTQTQMVAEWQRAKAYTKEYLDAMPEDGINFKPTADIRSFAEQYLHLANANYMFAANVSGKANPMQGKNMEKMEDMKNKAALTKAVLDSYDYVISALQATTEAQMADKIKLFNQDVTRDLGYGKAFEHQTHHRGQTTIYLRMKGVKPPAEKLF